MSLSEIIQRRFKPQIQIKNLSSSEDVEKFIIKPPSSVRAEQDFDSTLMQFEQNVRQNQRLLDF